MPAWRIEDQIGEGGFGAVYRAVRIADGSVFAAKFLSPNYVGNPDVAGRFLREVSLQQLLQHRHIVPIIATYLKENPPWFVMPLARGSVANVVLAGMTEAQVDELFTAVLGAIAYAHEQGVIHRDLKPDNVLIAPDGTPLVGDFGLGKNLLADSDLVTQAGGAGTPYYSAPEQIRDLRAADARSDIYALGKLLTFMLARELPVLADDPKVPERYRYFIAKCTAERVADRFQTMTDVIAAFEQVKRGVETPEAPREAFDRIVREWSELPSGEDLAAIREVDRLLQTNSDDGDLYREKLPKLPAEMLEQYMEALPADFRRAVGYYDEHVSGSLPFSYCDVVADFYRRIFGATKDLALRRRLLARLIEMGASHNRFHVGDVVAQMLAAVRETSEAMMAADVISAADPGHVRFLVPYARGKAMVSLLSDVVKKRSA